MLALEAGGNFGIQANSPVRCPSDTMSIRPDWFIAASSFSANFSDSLMCLPSPKSRRTSDAQRGAHWERSEAIDGIGQKRPHQADYERAWRRHFFLFFLNSST